jgi:adenine-specific DNA-methyltransferase
VAAVDVEWVRDLGAEGAARASGEYNEKECGAPGSSTSAHVSSLGIVTLLDSATDRRRESLASLDPKRQADFGQYFTPVEVARAMAALPVLPDTGIVRILDPGAGSGVLASALVDRILAERPKVQVELTAVELDSQLATNLRAALDDIAAAGATTRLVEADFTEWALNTKQRFDIVIQNPPYAKLRSGSPTWVTLQREGIDVPNIYAAFLALGARLLEQGGQQVSITPRSWMNGTYYRNFRRAFVAELAIAALHIFESRSKVFGDTGVLQESIIVCARKGKRAGEVALYSSHDHREVPAVRHVAYSDVVTGDFLHVPATAKDADAVRWMAAHAVADLDALGVKVSTGRVVDFRSRDALHTEHLQGAHPMVFSSHFVRGEIEHPKPSVKKPQWYSTDPAVEQKMLVPAGTYVLVKRFSAKEERRRVVAALWESEEPVAFDNKLNYIHAAGVGLDPALARGLVTWLNSTRLDDYFRVLSGHTQVNAGDLRQMTWPTAVQLRELAASYNGTQPEVDLAVEAVLTQNRAAA